MKIKIIGNKIIERIAIIEGVAGVILVSISAAIIFNKRVDDLFLSFISSLIRKPPTSQRLAEIQMIADGLLVIGLIVLGLFILPYWDNLRQNKLILQLGLGWEGFKQKRVARIMAPLGAILFITIMIVVKVFSFNFIDNEFDILPIIKQVADHSWLPNDWYLNIITAYRQLFGFLFGPLISRLGFENGVYLARIIVWLLIAIAIYVFFKTLHLRPWFGILVLIIFLNHQSLVAGEWIIGGLETKPIAYAMVFLSLAFFLRQRYFWGFVFAGAAMSFHVLIGIYAVFCIGAAFILNKAWRNDWRTVLKNSWPFLITGVFGLWAVVGQLLPQKGIDLVQAWLIYVKFRVPQHVLPKAWSPWGNPWQAELAIAAGFFLIMYFFSNSKKGRFIAAFSLGSVFLFLTGMVIYALGNAPLLRFYWFRFPDVMVPFMSVLLIALFLNDFADKRFTKNSLFQRIQFEIQTIFRLLPPIIIGFLIVMMVQQTNRVLSSYHASLHPNPPVILSTLNWISKNTPKQAIFLVDPSESDFYIYAQRAMVVSWKSSPESAGEILEWYKRIKLLNGNVDLDNNRGYAASQELQSNFYKLNASQVQQIAKLYRINYFLGLSTQNFPFERVYSDSTYAVYKVK
jgi:hypothetical protein